VLVIPYATSPRGYERFSGSAAMAEGELAHHRGKFDEGESDNLTAVAFVLQDLEHMQSSMVQFSIVDVSPYSPNRSLETSENYEERGNHVQGGMIRVFGALDTVRPGFWPRLMATVADMGFVGEEAARSASYVPQATALWQQQRAIVAQVPPAMWPALMHAALEHVAAAPVLARNPAVAARMQHLVSWARYWEEAGQRPESAQGGDYVFLYGSATRHAFEELMNSVEQWQGMPPLDASPNSSLEDEDRAPTVLQEWYVHEQRRRGGVLPPLAGTARYFDFPEGSMRYQGVGNQTLRVRACRSLIAEANVRLSERRARGRAWLRRGDVGQVEGRLIDLLQGIRLAEADVDHLEREEVRARQNRRGGMAVVRPPDVFRVEGTQWRGQ
jgi:hypothetical protein